MGGKADRIVVPAVIGLMPLAFMLLTWAPDSRTPPQDFVQGLYLPVAAMELFVIVVALRRGMVRAMAAYRWSRIPTVALFVLATVAVATAITAPNAAAARLWTSHWFLHLLFGFSVMHLCTLDLDRRSLVTWYLIGFVAFMVGAMRFTSQVRDPAFDWTHGWPAATHIRHYGYYCAAMIALCIGAAAAERGRLRLLTLFLVATFGFAFALWTGSRGAVVGVAGAVAASVVLVPAMRRWSILAGAALSLVMAGLIASLIPAPGPLMGFGRTITQTVQSGDVSTGRTLIWTNALGAIEKRPLFGYGENQMATVAPFHGLGQTHNVILQILLAWGAVGLACVGILAAWFFARSLPLLRSGNRELMPPFMAMLAIAALALIDGALFHVIPVSLFAASAGMIASAWKSREELER